MSELVKGKASYHKTLLHVAYIQMTVLPKVRTALCAASELPGEGPTYVEDAPAPAL